MKMIRKGLFIAALADIINETEQLLALRVTQILTVDSQELPISLKRKLICKGVKIKYLHMRDEASFSLLDALDEAFQNLLARKPTDITVVHCFAGVSRSASIIIAYLMKTEDISFDEAFKDVQGIKEDIFPNPGFQEQLIVFEKMGKIVDKTHPLYRKHVMDKLTTNSAPSYNNQQLRLEDDSPNLPISNVKCRKCRVTLLKPSNIRHCISERCSSIFLTEPEEWMLKLVADIPDEGKLYCPHCQSKLGSFNWQGAKCSCNALLRPSFQIQRSKVDATTTTITATTTCLRDS